MSFTITTSKSFQALISKADNKNLIGKVRKEFSKNGPTKVKKAIVQDMIRGISPVKGEGKWVKYSNSYKEVIQGKATYRNVGGKVIRINKPDREYLSASRPTKAVTPINLRHTGKLHQSLKSFFTGNTLIIQFKHFLADIHNRLGAGRSKTVRRMLPTNRGEQFNRTINKVLLNELKKAVDKVAQRF